MSQALLRGASCVAPVIIKRMSSLVYILIVVAVVLISMTLHEAMHAYAGYWLGDDTAKLMGRLSLNPLRHIDPFLTIILPLTLALVGAPIFGGAKPVPFNPDKLRWGDWGVAILALAGPVTNFMIAFVMFGVWALAGAPQNLIGQVMTYAVYINLGLFIFNMLPIPPLDGSRLLYALAPDFIRTGMQFLEKFGIIIVLLLVAVSGSAFSSFLLSTLNFFFTMFSHIFGL